MGKILLAIMACFFMHAASAQISSTSVSPGFSSSGGILSSSASDTYSKTAADIKADILLPELSYRDVQKSHLPVSSKENPVGTKKGVVSFSNSAN